MKLLLILLLVVVLVVVILLGGIYMWIAYGGIPIRVDSSFATMASLKYDHGNKITDVEITDAEDVKTLRRICSGWASRIVVSCGYVEEVTITLSDGQRSVSFVPACGGYPRLGLAGTDPVYLKISKEDRRVIDDICKKYGVKLPR